jgi:RNA polymerase sigma factor (sigma-70 family)
MTDLVALKSRDFETRKTAFELLKEDVCRSCNRRLRENFPQEIDDVVSEAILDVYKKIDELNTNEDLAKLTKSIAENKAISRWRLLTAKKRSEHLKESLDATVPDDEGKEKLVYEPVAAQSHLDELDVKDIQNIINTLQAELKPEYKQALHDFFNLGLNQEEISQKRGWPRGGVGVYVKRGLEAMRKQRLKYPQLTKEALQYIVRMLL